VNGVNGVLFELLWRGYRGALVQRARRLRRPRYLVAFLLSVAYFGFLVLPSFLRWSRRPGGFDGANGALGAHSAGFAGAGDAALIALFIASLAMAAAVTVLWIFASSKPALQLGEADIDLLLPAPLSRRKVIELSLWRQQAGLLLGALVLTLFRGSGPPSVRLGRLFISWSLLTLASLHSKGVSLWKARLKELPPAAARRRVAAAIAGGIAFWAAVAMSLRGVLTQALETLQTSPALPAAAGGALRLDLLPDLAHRLATAPPLLLSILLAPFRWLSTAILAGAVRSSVGLPGSGWQAAAAGLFLAALVAAHYEWVVRSRARFEEAALERARRQAARRGSRRALPAPAARARRQEPFRLAPVGLAETAIYWKNLLLGSRTPLARRAAIALLPGLAAWVVLAASGAPVAAVTSVAGCGLALMAVLPILGGLGQRQDLRMDLLQFEVLRAWPVRGWRLVAAELLAPTTAILAWTVAAWGMVLGAALAAESHPGRADPLRGTLHADLWQHAAARGGGALGVVAALSAALLLAGAAISLLSIAVQNVAALVLPGWVTLGPERRAGPTMTGQRMLMMIGQLLALAVALIPAVLLAGAAVAAGRWLGIAPAPWQAPLLALLGCLPVVAEVGLLVRIGGAFWDRLDPSEEILSPPP
jgi:ABC-2 type transport system permease protein